MIHSRERVLLRGLLLVGAAPFETAQPAIDGLTTMKVMPLSGSIAADLDGNVGGYRDQLKTGWTMKTQIS